MKATTPHPNEPMEPDMTKFFSKTAAAALIASAIAAPTMAQNASGTIQLKG